MAAPQGSEDPAVGDERAFHHHQQQGAAYGGVDPTVALLQIKGLAESLSLYAENALVEQPTSREVGDMLSFTSKAFALIVQLCHDTGQEPPPAMAPATVPVPVPPLALGAGTGVSAGQVGQGACGGRAQSLLRPALGQPVCPSGVAAAASLSPSGMAPVRRPSWNALPPSTLCPITERAGESDSPRQQQSGANGARGTYPPDMCGGTPHADGPPPSSNPAECGLQGWQAAGSMLGVQGVAPVSMGLMGPVTGRDKPSRRRSAPVLGTADAGLGMHGFSLGDAYAEGTAPPQDEPEEAGGGNAAPGGGTTLEEATARFPDVTAWLNANVMYRESTLARETLYAEFCRAMQARNVTPVSCGCFGKVVRALFPSVQSRRLGGRGKSKYHYHGIGCKSAELAAAFARQEEAASQAAEAAPASRTLGLGDGGVAYGGQGWHASAAQPHGMAGAQAGAALSTDDGGMVVAGPCADVPGMAVDGPGPADGLTRGRSGSIKKRNSFDAGLRQHE